MLGPFEVRLDGQPVAIGAPKLRTMLAVLAASANRAVMPEGLVDELWGERPPASAVANIRTYAMRLRRLLPPDRLSAAGSGYLLRVRPGELDLDVFAELVAAGRTALANGDPATGAEALTSACGLWRGRPFESVPVGAGLAARRTALEDVYLSTAELAFEAQLRLGRHHAVLPLLRGHVGAHPLREHGQALLMLALYRVGDPAAALDVFASARAALVGDIGIEPGTELTELRQAVLRRDNALLWSAVSAESYPVEAPDPPMPGDATKPADRPRPAEPLPVPMEVPASIADFVGRRGELGELGAMLRAGPPPDAPGSAVIVAISGMGGIGKTTLAVRLAHEVRDEYPDGCLYVDLRGTDAQPTPPRVVLGAFLHALGISTETTPADLAGRERLYRSVLAGRRMLLVLDNAATDGQVRPLLPGAGCGVLVTSRPLLTGLAGARLVAVDPLPLTDGVRLLTRVAGQSRIGGQRDDAERVVALCGGLPLAIRVAAVRLVRSRTMDTVHLADRLADERRRLDELVAADLDVRASLEVGYQHLDGQAARLLGLLSLVPFPTVTPAFGAALLELPAREAERLFDDLSAAHLISIVDGDRYRIHDLVRLHAAVRARDTEPAAALDAAVARVCRALLATAVEANGRLPCRASPVPAPAVPVEDPPADPVGWFEAMRGHLVVAVDHAVRLGWRDLAGRLAASMVNFCMMRGYQDEWEHSHRAVLDAPGCPLDPAVEATLWLNLGNLYRFRDDDRAALALLRRAYRQFEKVGEPLGAACAALCWSVAAGLLGRPRFARAMLEAAFTHLDRYGGSTPLAGYAVLATRDTPDRAGTVRRALAIFDELGEGWGAAEAHAFLGQALHEQGQLEAAITHLRRAIEMYAELRDRLNLTMAENSLAGVYLTLGALDRARDLLDRTLRTARELRHPWGEATALRNLGRLHLAESRPAQAIAHLEPAVTILRATGQQTYLARTLYLLGRARLAGGDRLGAAGDGREAYGILGTHRHAEAAAVGAWLSTVDGNPAESAAPAARRARVIGRTNWAGNVVFSASRYLEPSTVDELRGLVAGSERIHAVGTGHSFSRLADTCGDLVSLAGLPPVMDIDIARRVVRVCAGVRYGELAPYLHSAGYALANLASLAHLSVAGAVATGTHGSGDRNGNLATSVAELELVAADGELVTLRRGGDRFAGAVVGLGVLGIVTAVTLDIVPAFDVAQYVYENLPRGQLDEHWAEIFGSAYSVSLFTDWTGPEVNQLWLKRRIDGREPAPGRAWLGARLADGPRHPIARLPAAGCTAQLGAPGPWYARLPHFRVDAIPSSGAELQSEYLVAREHGMPALAAIDRIRDRVAPVVQVSEVRTVAADDLWLSPSYRRDSLAIHFTWVLDVPAVAAALAAVEEALAPFAARPHWAKLFRTPPAVLRDRYDRWADFVRLRRAYDPTGKFGNELVDRYFPIEGHPVGTAPLGCRPRSG